MMLTILNILSILLLFFLGYISLKKEQSRKLNWSLFYSLLFTSVTLPIINYVCIHFGFWEFKKTNTIGMPLDLYFIWVVIWSVIPVYFFKGKYTLLIALFILWLDVLTMPILEEHGILKLNKNWLLGEILIISLVFLPSYYWAKISYQYKQIGIRATFQVTIMTLFFLIILPFTMKTYGLLETIDFCFDSIELQIFFIVVFPSLIAVLDLVQKGQGTPFPYDKTQFLVKSGVYAYCKNPIQWSFTFMFIPLAIFHHSYFFLLGSIGSIAYAFAISDFQEYQDMEMRFNKDWQLYKNNVPKWYFLWKPTHIPKGIIYFDYNCNTCTSVKNWMKRQKTTNLEIKNAANYKGEKLLQVTYVDYLGNEYKSIKAIAHALEHINLAYANLGWFMRFPIVHQILQTIIDTMSFQEDSCEVRKDSI